MEDDNCLVQTVEIIKRPGQSLGFYIREGNGRDRWDGVFLSRLAAGSVADQNGLLRVGDEIVSVNGMMVNGRRLEDVVISMSIPKRLVLVVRTPTHTSACSETTSSSSLSALGGPVADEEDSQPPPIVVVKGGRTSVYGEAGYTNTIERTRRSSDMIKDGTLDNRMSSGTMKRSDENRTLSSTKGQNHSQYVAGDDSGDSGLSSDNSGFFRPTDQCHGMIRNSQHGNFSISGDGNLEIFDGTRSDSSSHLFNHNSADGFSRYGLQQPINPDERFKPQQLPQGLYGSPYVHPDYSSDSDVYAQKNRLIGRYSRMKENECFQEQMEQTRNFYDSATSNTKRRCKPGDYVTLGRRYSQSQAEQPVSDLESMMRMAGQRSSKERPLSVRDKYITQLMMSAADRYAYLNGSDKKMGSDLKSMLRRFDSLSFEQKTNRIPDDSSDKFSGDAQIGTMLSGHKDFYNPDRKPQHMTPNHINSSVMPTGIQPETVPRAVAPNPRCRMTRKLSCDSLYDYKTYQMPEPAELRDCNMFDGSGRMDDDIRSGARRTPTGSSMPYSAMTLARSQPRALTKQASVGTTPREVHLAKAPLHIRKEAFKLYQPIMMPNDTKRGVNGLVLCHIFCGHGLVSSRAALQDLYTVIEIDSLGCARTTVHTGAMNFDWDDRFEIELNNAQTLSFSVYIWDPYGRHRLGYSASVTLSILVQQAAYHRLAVRLDPKGVLYMELVYREVDMLFRRTPSVHANSIFGTDLQSLVDQEKTGSNMPVLVCRCVEEVERRGMDQVGIYRLCGSARRKQQLKEELDKDVYGTDLSSEAVGDINVITVVLKEFLRELPEPLFTNALYRMLMDALSVQMPGDNSGNAQLMISIVECLPKVNQDTLTFILDHLKRISLRSDVNKMTTTSLAVCFGPILLYPSTPSSVDASQRNLLNYAKHAELLKYILDIWPENRDRSLPLGRICTDGGCISGNGNFRSTGGHHETATNCSTDRHPGWSGRSTPVDSSCTNRGGGLYQRPKTLASWDDSETTHC